jgi:branched-chain amino acid transport system ATP-binding protein
MTPRLTVGEPGGMPLHVGPGEIVAVIGANGAGKSRLLRSVVGFAEARGDIRLDGSEIGALRTHQRSRAGIGYCPEGRRVFARMTVRENLEVAARAHGAGDRLAEMFDLFPALADRRDTQAGQLSGGEQQMLAIGRALMTEPRLLLLDEPSLGLSPRLVETILGTLRTVAAGGTSVLLAEQNAAQALAVADRAYVMRLGRIVHSGTAAELRNDPQLARAFLGG